VSGGPLAPLAAAHGRFVHARRSRVLAEHFSRLLPRGVTVLDVGCGDGRVARSLLERRPDLLIAGVDVRVRDDSGIAVTEFDGKTLPFAAEAWDAVLLCDVLHHAASPVDLLAEAARVARSRVVIKDHLVQGILARPTLRLMDFLGNAPHGVASPGNYFTPDQWSAAYRHCGLSLLEDRLRLGLYPKWVDLLFGRGLHFVAALTPVR
jgi:SAM-dependent methyltransferase